MQDVRICFFGDSLVNGTGDSHTLGWAGRLCNTVNHSGFQVTNYNLGIRRDTSADVLSRWQNEFQVRFAENAEMRMIFSFGVNDTAMEEGQQRLTLDESLSNARKILSIAAKVAKVLWVGPSPVIEVDHNLRIETLSKEFSKLAKEMDIDYLTVYDELLNNEAWMDELARGDGSHPDNDGYTALTHLIHQWPSWWFK